MRPENEGSKDHRESYENPGTDRLDWMSKYLEVADRAMENYMLQRSENGRKA